MHAPRPLIPASLPPSATTMPPPTGVNVWTHGELLPAHGYPELKQRFPHLVGNYGGAWYAQQREFAEVSEAQRQQEDAVAGRPGAGVPPPPAPPLAHRCSLLSLALPPSLPCSSRAPSS